ncbi:MAG: hypothetical protein J5616_00565 [Bacteroidaceae bacterium]|nr:hypothetical protein [Bacteroidaceae bacterium]
MKLSSIFNCSNDMALAANVRQYLPPRRIQQMEADLENLARVWDDTPFAGPWGWSLATKQRYKQMGIPMEQLPSDEWLDEVRRLSSREYACGYIRNLLAEMKDERLLGREMRFIKAPSDSPKGEGRHPSGFPIASIPHGSSPLGGIREGLIFKSPWSSSGRGVFVSSSFDAQTEKRLQGFLSSQGGFVVDRFYDDKVLDFAMEFFIHQDHRVEFLGYSVFHAAEHGAYGYNYVESQPELLQRIDIDHTLLQRLIAYHQEYLSRIAYHGPVGIDMLKTADGRIHPCLEINLRMNMGILALLLYERYGSHASVALTPGRDKGFKALIDDGKLLIDYMPS